MRQPTPPSAHRRRVLELFGAGLLAGCATPPPAGSAATSPAATADEVATGVFMLQGLPGDVDTHTLGRVGNAGFIVGPQGVLAIDTGTSYLHGQALLRAIARVTPLPIRAAYLTHTRQEFLFGAAAYRERGIPLHMQRQAARLMAARCESCLKTLRRVLGDAAMTGTTMFTPDVIFDASHVSEAIGRRVRIDYFGPSSGPGDSIVMDEASRVVFAGGLLDWQRIPDVQDGQLGAWKAALARLAELQPAALVPGHGPLAPPSAIDTEVRYLTQLEARLAELLRADTALSAVPDQATLAEFSGWDQADTIHRRNASVVYLRLERELLFKAGKLPG